MTQAKTTEGNIYITIILLITLIITLSLISYSMGYNRGYMKRVNDLYCNVLDKITFNPVLEETTGNYSERALTGIEISYLHRRGMYKLECDGS